MAKVERDFDKPRYPFSLPKPKDDERNGDIGPHNVSNDDASQAEKRTQPAQSHRRWIEESERPASKHADDGAQKDLSRRQRLREHKPEHKQAGTYDWKGQKPPHDGPRCGGRLKRAEAPGLRAVANPGRTSGESLLASSPAKTILTKVAGRINPGFR